MSLDQTAPVIIVSADSHVGPRLREDLRGYCPARRLDDYDALIAQTGPIVNVQALLGHPNAGPGHYDPAARLADMDSDGVAAEVIYHGSQNGEPLPWGGSAKFGIGTFDAFDSSLLELSELGCDIYDRWLADFCSADPKRLLGLFHIPAWDIGKSADVARRAAAAGLNGVNFPVCGRAGIRPYNDPAWDPFWAACVENGITLHTHGNGAPIFDSATGPGAEEITISDVGGWSSRRAPLPDLRPGVRPVPRPDTGDHGNRRAVVPDHAVGAGLPVPPFRPHTAEEGRAQRLLPDERLHGRQLHVPAQATEASKNGYASNVIWGRDYPHMEGAHQAGDFAEPVHLTAIRNVMFSVPQQDALNMAGQRRPRHAAGRGLPRDRGDQYRRPHPGTADHPGRILPQDPPPVHGIRGPVRPAPARPRRNGDVHARSRIEDAADRVPRLCRQSFTMHYHRLGK